MQAGEGIVLRKMRLLAGLTQGKMARLMNVDKSTISRYENGRIPITLTDAKRWASQTGHHDLLIAFLCEGQMVVADVVSNMPTVVNLILPFVA